MFGQALPPFLLELRRCPEADEGSPVFFGTDVDQGVLVDDSFPAADPYINEPASFLQNLHGFCGNAVNLAAASVAIAIRAFIHPLGRLAVGGAGCLGKEQTKQYDKTQGSTIVAHDRSPPCGASYSRFYKQRYYRIRICARAKGNVLAHYLPFFIYRMKKSP